MGEIADDHYSEIKWSHGLNSVLYENALIRSTKMHKCRFCDCKIYFSNRKAYDENGIHKCLNNKSITDLRR